MGSSSGSFNAVADLTFEENLGLLKVLFSARNDDLYLKNALEACHGNHEDAIDLLCGDPPENLAKAVQLLQKKFPNSAKSHLIKMLINCRGSFDDAVLRLGDEKAPSQFIESSGGRTSTTITKYVSGRQQIFDYTDKTTEFIHPQKHKADAFRVEAPLQKMPLLSASKVVPLQTKRDLPTTDNSAIELESFDTKAERLYELFGGKVEMNDIKISLASYGDDIEEAFNDLNDEYKLLDDDVVEISPPRSRVRRDSGVSGLDENPKGSKTEAADEAENSTNDCQRDISGPVTVGHSGKENCNPEGIIPSVILRLRNDLAPIPAEANAEKGSISRSALFVTNDPKLKIESVESSTCTHIADVIGQDLHEMLPSSPIRDSHSDRCHGNAEGAFQRLEQGSLEISSERSDQFEDVGVDYDAR